MEQFTNKVFCEDNLDLLHRLPDNSLSLIYCDILYGTGRKFKDFIDLKPNKKIVTEFYAERLKEIRRVLKNDGSCYLQMDWHINHWVRCLMDDIFGYRNCRNEIVWHYDLGKASETYFKRKHDTILFYTKTDDYFFKPVKIPARNPKRYYLVDEGGQYIVDTHGVKSYLKDGISCDDVWTFVEEGRLRILNAKSLERTGYDTQKPKFLLNRIIEASSKPGDLVADFFCGSGSFVVAAKEAGRNYLACDISEHAVEIAKQRLNGQEEKSS